MIKKLQHRFILITMSCIGFIFLLVLLILNLSMTAASQNRGFHLLAEHIQKKNTSKPHAITLTQSAEKKRLLVHNTGKGIDIKDQKHIFERFYRIDNSRSRQSGGYGLGLAIAQSIVEKHNGHIGVKSDGQNFTEFWVLLP